ncbi:MAG: gluconate 2-dehydrogenase subunit 3 family protein [Candidatus Binatia bacterium]
MPGSISRRDFFLQGALYGGSVWAFVALPRPRTVEAAAASDARLVLRGADWKTVEAITARIIPTDEEPGAIEAGCVNFIDKALANEESAAKPLYEAGLAGLRAVCLARFRKGFLELEPNDQDEVLSSLSSDEAEGWPEGDVRPQAFFEIVRLHTILGYLSDPKYGGNRGYAGWKVAGYSAPRGPTGYTAKQLVGERRIRTIWEKPLPRTLEE